VTEQPSGIEPDARTIAHAVIANRLMMIRRGNPAMGGPSPQDYDRATDLVDELTEAGITFDRRQQ
jgi:hypothetical protein